MKKFVKRAVALSLALVMLLSVGILQSFAATVKSKRTFKNYVVIGDSIAAGACLKQIIKDNPYDAMNWLMNGDEIVEGSYPQLVRDAVGAKSTYKLAREGWTTKNVLRIIDPTYEEELAQPENYYERYETQATYFFSKVVGHPNEVNEMRDTATDAIKNADVVTVHLGNNDTFTVVLEAYYLHYMHAVLGIPLQSLLTFMKNEYVPITSWQQLFEAYHISDISDFLTMCDQAIVQYEANYDRLIGRIRELNPDCEIYTVGMYNIFAQSGPEWFPLQPFLAERNADEIEELADYYTNRSAYKDEVTYVDISDTEVWWSFPMYTPLYWSTMVVFTHPTFEGHEYIANQIIRAMNKNAKTKKSTK